MRKGGVYSCVLISMTAAGISVPAGAAEEDVMRVHRSPTTIAIATGHDVPLNLAPAVATVITAEELDSIGATTLSEALALIPGVNVIWRRQGDHFVFRGVRSDSNFNPDWLLMVDYIPQTDVLFGNQRLHIGDIPIQNIKRIEVIRGPGSALYGADAFAGTVNIITKLPSDVTGSEARVRAGSLDTREYRYLRRDDLFSLYSLLSLQVRKTDGHEPFVEMDAQTFWDRRLGTNASLAPAHRTTWEDDYILNWDLEQGPWRGRFRHHTRDFADALGGALDPGGWFDPTSSSVDVIYDQPVFSEDWGVKWHLGWFRYDADSHNTRVYPPGAFGGAFPDGLFDEIGYTEKRLHTDLSGLYAGTPRHAVLLGIGAEQNEVYNVRERRNYRLSSTGTPIPLGQVVELGPEDVFGPNARRTVYFVYGQDEWSFAPDWVLTSGVRYDHYSDFGGTTNPRLALVWATTAELTTKFLAGRAFRAPTFLDLDARNNPAVMGNPDLKPEIIKTYEVSFDYRPNPSFRTGINFFYHDIKDKIHAVGGTLATTNENVGAQTGRGGEWEWKWNVSRELILTGWYAHQRNEVKDDGSDAGFAPRNSANLRIDWQFVPNWYFNTNTIWVADRARPADDVRPPLPDYTIVDVTLRYRKRNSSWSAALSVFNVFDKEALDPSDPPGRDRSDLLLPERSIFAEFRYYPQW